MPKPHISYVPLEQMDERMQEEMHRCAREGTPRPESSAVRAHAPNAFWAFADSWKSTLPQRRLRPRDQGPLPRLHLPHGEVRVLRQPALGEGDQGRPRGDAVRRPAELREERPVRRAAEGGAVLRGGDRLGHAGRRGGLLGPAARALLRAGAGRARLRHRADLRPAELDPAARHRPPPVHGRHRRLDGARLPDRRGARREQGVRRTTGRPAPPAEPLPAGRGGHVRRHQCRPWSGLDTGRRK